MSYMSLVDMPDGSGGLNKTLRISGINVQLVNGLGATNGLPGNPNEVDTAQIQVNGAGNLIVGYGELIGSMPQRTRLGSHTISVGVDNGFAKFGGLVGAKANDLQGAFGSISGGRANVIGDAPNSYGSGSNTKGNSISGGAEHSARGYYGSISGGKFNSSGARGYLKAALAVSIAGGLGNSADGANDSISGGRSNSIRYSEYGSIGGGKSNSLFLVERASIGGGKFNRKTYSGSGAQGAADSISGGLSNEIAGYTEYATISGGQLNMVYYSATYGSVAGGYAGTAGDFGSSGSSGGATVSGGSSNTSLGSAASVSGGASRTALATNDWNAGALFEDD